MKPNIQSTINAFADASLPVQKSQKPEEIYLTMQVTFLLIC